MQSHENRIIAQLVEHEQLIAELYTVYAERNPPLRDFWNQLVIEEKAHAHVIVELGKRLGHSHVFFDANRFTQAGIQSSLDHVRRLLDSARKGPLTTITALAHSRDLETAIIEKDFFEVFRSDLPYLKREFTALRNHTIEHVARITKRLQDAREKQQESIS